MFESDLDFEVELVKIFEIGLKDIDKQIGVKDLDKQFGAKDSTRRYFCLDSQ